MIKNSHQSPRPIQSPRRLLYNLQMKPQQQVEEEYQLKANKNTKKKQSSAFRRSPHLNPSSIDKSTSKRRISLKRVNLKSNKEESHLEQKQINESKLIKNVQSSSQLALQIEYNQFWSKNAHAEKQQSTPASDLVKRRIRRIRSSSILSRGSTASTDQMLGQKLAFAQQENIRLKELKISTFAKLDSLQEQYNDLHSEFEAQIISYQRQICALKNKVEKNKNQFGHIFTYESYDPVKLFTKPIIEVEGENSHFQSHVRQSSINELQHESRLRDNHLLNSDRKEKLTETTGAASREDYGQLQLF